MAPLAIRRGHLKDDNNELSVLEKNPVIPTNKDSRISRKHKTAPQMKTRGIATSAGQLALTSKPPQVKYYHTTLRSNKGLSKLEVQPRTANYHK